MLPNTLAAAILVSIASSSLVQGIVVVRGAPQGGDGVNQDTNVRREINEFSKSGPPFHLFILSLKAMQDRKQTDQLSFFQIAGIHGYPMIPWDDVVGNGTYPGYCTHEAITFPTWHRVYMALFEQIIVDIAQDIAKTYPQGRRDIFETAAASLRIPYWDWIENQELPSVVTSSQILVDSPHGQRYIGNPLYNYTFHPGPEGNGFPNTFHMATVPWTVRWFDHEAQTSSHELANKALRARAPLILTTTFKLFNYVSRYNEFAYMKPRIPDPFQNIELLHNTIHNAVGGENSHIKHTEFSAFDPVFFLHHANLDRLFALWQAVNPRGRFESEVDTYGSYMASAGSLITIDTALAPFHSNKQGRLWTSRDVWDMSVFKYTYPELVGVDISVEDRVKSVRQYLSTTYFSRMPQMPILDIADHSSG